ncbi:hypothetical protein MRY87_06135 [bacterium]|nr:hypothetical protein [bacterium]
MSRAKEQRGAHGNGVHKGVMSVLSGISGHPVMACAVSEEFLSEQPFPREILSEELRREFSLYHRWLAQFPLREAKEIAFSEVLGMTSLHASEGQRG